MLERELNWARLRILQGVGIIVSNLVALAMARLGAGVYALLIPGLLVTLPNIYDLLVRAKWRPNWEASWTNFRPACRYGMARMGSGIVQTGRQLTESALLVQFLGFAGAGVYGRAIGLATMACLRLPSYLTLSLYPVLARVTTGSDAGRRASALVLQSILWGIVPAGAIMFALADPIVRVLYGDKWLAAIPLVPWTLVITGLTALSQALTVLLLVNHRQRQCLYADMISSALIVLALVVLLPRGLEYYLTGVAVALGVEVLAMLWWLVAASALDPRRLVRVVAVPLLAAVALLAASAPLYWNQAAHSWPVPAVAAFAFTFFGLYVVALRMTAPAPFAELISYSPGSERLRRFLRFAV